MRTTSTHRSPVLNQKERKEKDSTSDTSLQGKTSGQPGHGNEKDQPPVLVRINSWIKERSVQKNEKGVEKQVSEARRLDSIGGGVHRGGKVWVRKSWGSNLGG